MCCIHAHTPTHTPHTHTTHTPHTHRSHTQPHKHTHHSHSHVLLTLTPCTLTHPHTYQTHAIYTQSPHTLRSHTTLTYHPHKTYKFTFSPLTHSHTHTPPTHTWLSWVPQLPTKNSGQLPASLGSGTHLSAAVLSPSWPPSLSAQISAFPSMCATGHRSQSGRARGVRTVERESSHSPQRGGLHPAVQGLWASACGTAWFLKEGWEVYVKLPSFKTLVNEF